MSRFYELATRSGLPLEQRDSEWEGQDGDETSAITPPTASIRLGWRVQLHSMTGPRAAELNGALARVRGEKRSVVLYKTQSEWSVLPVSREQQPFVSAAVSDGGEENVLDRWAVELESSNKNCVLVKPANLAAVCAHVPCGRVLHAPKICSKCKVVRAPLRPQFCTRTRARVCAHEHVVCMAVEACSRADKVCADTSGRRLLQQRVPGLGMESGA